MYVAWGTIDMVPNLIKSELCRMITLTLAGPLVLFHVGISDTGTEDGIVLYDVDVNDDVDGEDDDDDDDVDNDEDENDDDDLTMIGD